MASKNKFKKARNSYCANALKFRDGDKCKRLVFFDAKQRKQIKKIKNEDLDNDKGTSNREV